MLRDTLGKNVALNLQFTLPLPAPCRIRLVTRTLRGAEEWEVRLLDDHCIPCGCMSEGGLLDVPSDHNGIAALQH